MIEPAPSPCISPVQNTGPAVTSRFQPDIHQLDTASSTNPLAICRRGSSRWPSRPRRIIAMNRPSPRGLSNRPMVAIG